MVSLGKRLDEMLRLTGVLAVKNSSSCQSLVFCVSAATHPLPDGTLSALLAQLSSSALPQRTIPAWVSNLHSSQRPSANPPSRIHCSQSRSGFQHIPADRSMHFFHSRYINNN